MEHFLATGRPRLADPSKLGPGSLSICKRKPSSTPAAAVATDKKPLRGRPTGQVATRENILRGRRTFCAAVEPFVKAALPAPGVEKTSKAARSTDRVYLLLRQQEGLVRRGVGSIAIRALGHFYLANLFALPIFLDAYLMAPPAALAG